jgi:hypothetical protein
MLEKLLAAHRAGKLQWPGSHADLADVKIFASFIAPPSKKRYAKLRSPAQRPCSPICHGIPTASPSQTIA